MGMALNKGYSFVSAVQSNKIHPDTFEIPDVETRHNLRPGDIVKLLFKPKCKGGIVERMWVRVFKRMKEGVYEGVLDNEPLYDLKEVLQCDDTVYFRPDHVADIAVKK
jgi:uncharacterized protein YegJ (DUF2314 family)